MLDTTFNTNRYGLPFAPMLGVNNHGQTIVLACAFLSKETTESFIWMFEEFKKAMPGGEPKMIITDQDAAMARAIFEGSQLHFIDFAYGTSQPSSLINYHGLLMRNIGKSLRKPSGRLTI